MAWLRSHVLKRWRTARSEWPRVSGQVTASTHDGGVILFHQTRGRLYRSNHVGAAIWEELERGHSVDAIAGNISAQYALSADTVRDHVMAFVHALQREQLLHKE